MRGMNLKLGASRDKGDFVSRPTSAELMRPLNNRLCGIDDEKGPAVVGYDAPAGEPSVSRHLKPLRRFESFQPPHEIIFRSIACLEMHVYLFDDASANELFSR